MRISRPHMWMQVAEVAAMRGTCYRNAVGAIVVKDRDIVSFAYNGPPSGEDHCQGNSCPRSETGGCIRAVHAEKNALMKATKSLGRLRLEDCDLYSTFSPCPECAALITIYRIHRVFYRYPYRLREGIELLTDGDIGVYRVTNAGLLIRESSGLIIDESELAW
jgi:dCMP deaminase